MKRIDMLSSIRFPEYISIIDGKSGSKQKLNLSDLTKSNDNQEGGFETDTATLERNLVKKLYGDDAFDDNFKNLIGGGDKPSKDTKKNEPKMESDSEIDIKINSDSEQEVGRERQLVKGIFGGGSTFDDFNDDFWNESAWTIDTEYNMVGGKGEALKIYRTFVAYVQNALGVKGGIPMSKLGGYYMKKAKKELPTEKDMNTLTKKARDIFDKDKSNAKNEYEKFVKEYQNKRGKKSE